MSVRVSFSGSCLSLILYDSISPYNIKEGILLGTIERESSHNISDSNICDQQTQQIINISGLLPCSCVSSFYSGCGKVNHDKITEIIGPHMQQVVGWYRCRSASDKFYLKETLVHNQLKTLLTPEKQNLFLMGVISNSFNGIVAPLQLKYKFLLSTQSGFEPVPCNILNLGDTSNSHYLLQSPHPVMYNCNSVVKTLENIRCIEPGVEEVKQLHNGLLQNISEQLPCLSRAQKRHDQSLQKLLHLRALCYTSSIISDYNMQVDEKDCFSEKKDPFAFVDSEMKRLKVRSGSNRDQKKNEPVKDSNKEIDQKASTQPLPTQQQNRKTTETPLESNISSVANINDINANMNRTSAKETNNKKLPTRKKIICNNDS